MQQNKKGSILLYVLFLSSFLALFFVSFQGELESTLEWTRDNGQSIEDVSGVRDALILLRNTPSDRTEIVSNDSLSLVSLTQTGNVFQETLRSDEKREYWITSSGASNTLGLEVTFGWPIDYRLIAFNSGSEASSVLIASGVTADSAGIPLSPILDTHLLVIDPLGWGVAYRLDTKNTVTLPESATYRLERDINGYTKDEWTYRIDYFQPKTRTDINWTAMGLYLK